MSSGKTPQLIDPTVYLALGMDRRTGLPKKILDPGSPLKTDIKKFLRLIDEQDFCNRFIWKNIPASVTSQELERMLYYKGQLCFFYDPNLKEFLITPYALDGTIDFYGRFNSVRALPWSNGTTESEKQAYKSQEAYFRTHKLKCVYDVYTGEMDENIYEDSCVLIHDYTKQISQTIIPRADINDPLLDVMAECVPYMQTALLLSTGINGVRVADGDQEASVNDAARGMKSAALNQNPWLPILGKVDFQELSPASVLKAEEYMLAMQSLDNLRLSGYGIDNKGLFEKKAHELQVEADINNSPTTLILKDALRIRQNFCDIVNSIWNVGISCELAENGQNQDIPMNEDVSHETIEGESENDTTI